MSNATKKHQIQLDHDDLFRVNHNKMFLKAFDGSSVKERSVMTFDLRGCQEGISLVRKYDAGETAKKSLANMDVDLTGSFSTDSDQDDARMIVKVGTEVFLQFRLKTIGAITRRWC